MMLNRIINCGRFIFALPFLVFGVFHFLNAQGMTGVVPSWLPAPLFWVYLTGLCLVAGSISIIIKRYAGLACQLLALLLLVFILTIHIPGLGNPAMAQMAMMGLLKDLGLLGGALAYAKLLADS